jgi:predicted ester cyclase
MRRIRFSVQGLVILLAAAAIGAGALRADEAAGVISGDYVEARTADVYTGPCFANSEVNVAGREAVLAWRVTQGAWQGVSVAGLAVAAAIRVHATLGDPFGEPGPGRAAILVDERASPPQRDALVSFAHAMAGSLVDEIEGVHSVPITFTVAGAAVSLAAGELLALRTRGLNHGDHLCGNEEVYYPPLTETVAAVPAVTLEHAYRGPGLGMTWSSPGKRSAFVGRFARSEPPSQPPSGTVPAAVPPAAPPDPHAANKELVRRYIDEVLSAGKLEVLDQLLAADFEDSTPGAAKDLRGPDVVRRAQAKARTIFPEVHYTIEDLIAEGDRVAARYTVRARSQDSDNAPGKPIAVTGITIFRIAGGKIREAWIINDQIEMFQQLGYTLQPPQ